MSIRSSSRNLAFRLSCLALASLSPGGCSDVPTAGQAGIIAESVYGQVRLSGKEDSIHRDHSGVRVQILGTDKIAFSSSDGGFSFKNLEAGRYHVLFTREGFDSVLYTTVILPPANVFIQPPTLPVADERNIRIDSTWIRSLPSRIELFIELTIKDSIPEGAGLLAYFSHDPSVSVFNNEAVLSGSTWAENGKFTVVHTLINLDTTLIYQEPRPHFVSGDSGYVAIYLSSGAFPHPTLPISRPMNVRSKSNTAGFLLP